MMRLRRKRRLLRARRKAFELTCLQDNTARIAPGDMLLMSTIRNEAIRLPYFLDYYRERGVRHFLIVDNDSSDGSTEHLLGSDDVSLWWTSGSYKSATFGVDWLNHLARRYAHGHWTLTVDPDEFLVYPFCDSRPLPALTDWLETSGHRSFSAMLLDMYPKGSIETHEYAPGQDPLEITQWFDSGNYMISKNPRYRNLWIQGGPRARTFFQDEPSRAPALNKIPLVKWNRRYAYVSSTHMLLPRGLNLVYEEWGGEKASGVLLHAKFLNTFGDKASEECLRRQHYGDSVEYLAYARASDRARDLWTEWSEKYENWRQLERLGLMSTGHWA